MLTFTLQQLEDPAFAPRLRDSVIIDRYSEFEDHMIVLHPEEPRWLVMNEASSDLLEKLDGKNTLGSLVREYQDLYDVPAETLQQDIISLFRSLYFCNLIENLPLEEEEAEKHTPRPPSMTIYVTEQCNLRCKHCAIVEGKMPETLLTNDDIKDLIDQHTTNYHKPTVSFLGGEPLMRKDTIELIEYACTKTDTVNISTNGYYVTEDLAARLAKCKPLNLQVSLDGADPEVHDFIRGKGAYQKTWTAIERLVHAEMASQLIIGTVLTKCVFHQVKQLIARCTEMEIGQIRFLPLNKTKAAETHWGQIAPDPDDYKDITRYLIFEAMQQNDTSKTQVSGSFPGFVPNAKPGEGHWCPLGKTLIVDSQGEVYNCPSLTINEVTIGNVYDKSLKEMVEGEKNKEARDMILRRRNQVEECRQCAWRNFCQGGCAAFMSHRSGSLFINDQFCEFRRDLYREFVFRKAGLISS